MIKGFDQNLFCNPVIFRRSLPLQMQITWELEILAGFKQRGKALCGFMINYFATWENGS